MLRGMNVQSNCIIVFLICTIPVAAQTLSVSGGSGAPGSTVALSISLSSSGSTQLAGVQWDLTYPSTVLSPAPGTYWARGTAATAAGKQASCNLVKPGDIRCLVTGFNSTSIQDGVLATVTLQISASTTSTSAQVNLTGTSGTDSSGSPITMTGSDASITIDQPTGTASVLSIAQLASGGGWDTTLTLVNTGGAASEATLNFFDNDGNPLQLPLTFPQTPSSASQLVASTLDQTLNANSLLLMDSQQPGNPNTQVGSARLLTNGNVGGFAIFKYLQTGQEAVVHLQTSNAPSYMLAFDNTGVLATGLADVLQIAFLRGRIPEQNRWKALKQRGSTKTRFCVSVPDCLFATHPNAVEKRHGKSS